MAGSLIHLFVCVAVVLRVYFVTKQTAPFFVYLFVDPGKFETAWHRTDGRRVDLAPSPFFFFSFSRKMGTNHRRNK